jgi:hypothetical protein
LKRYTFEEIQLDTICIDNIIVIDLRESEAQQRRSIEKEEGERC